MTDAIRPIEVTRVCGDERRRDVDRAAAEEPLEIRLHGRPFAVVMRTPGADVELAAGFLLAERVVAGADDLGLVEHCTDPSADHPENIVNVTLANGSASRLDELLAGGRRVTTNASCGLCGRQTIDSIRCDVPPIAAAWTVASATVRALPDRLRDTQHAFTETGGLHAAALFTRDGRLELAAEDVGRHNAVDKLVGRMLMLDALPLGERLLFVSGRASFEIVQKALFAGIPIVAAVSAPSSLAIDLAQDAGITLVGFVRGQSFNIYTHPERVDA